MDKVVALTQENTKREEWKKFVQDDSYCTEIKEKTSFVQIKNEFVVDEEGIL